ncbi:hypothetical protein NQ317_005356 [Molorchus minor]|uniref:Uncharacterized protein n=1 Tax=Molorchus minor TaxID=1323400 RepID=A0ABQ9J2H3_9CUCU|nr:hypothetical protein NQ317_005356 [Molorchus minor]
MELLDNKHVQSLGGHLVKLIRGLSELHQNTLELFSSPALFPVEVDLSNSAFQYKSTTPIVQDNEEEEEEESVVEDCEEANENRENLICNIRQGSPENDDVGDSDLLLPNLQPAAQIEPNYDEMDNMTLLSSLCLQDKSHNGSLLPDLD